jgi:flavodoxin I
MDESQNKKAIIIYGTGSGNAELVAECVQAGMNEAGLKTDCQKGEVTDPKTIVDYDLIVLICATWDVGRLQPYFVPFYKEFCKLDLKDKPMAVVGLGDSKHYDIFCGAADLLEDAVKKVGAKQIVPTLRIDGPPHAKLEEYHKWGADLISMFNQ